ncbi:chemotaxis protein CheW [Pseudothermotoga thermarum]|uniref:CheW protein n=1 Tax=Pseudothermotoga thermarum DSM 5069 TaxID=688269 RepID=F7YXX9_9THEM|nr:chemotaxis protein CheW [Pseudothermotoga thermarum]AEH50778.1 CheW protein [Pseudothermotoga thermarum DSM 5069]
MAEQKIFEVFVFSIGDQEMAFDIEYVSMVIDKAEITPVPRSKPTVLGVMNLRGRIVPVISLPKLLGLQDSASEEVGKIVVVNWEEIEAGFAVSKVKGVTRCSIEEVEKLYKLDKFGEKCKGIIKKGDELIVYLSLDKILEELTAAYEHV